MTIFLDLVRRAMRLGCPFGYLVGNGWIDANSVVRSCLAEQAKKIAATAGNLKDVLVMQIKPFDEPFGCAFHERPKRGRVVKCNFISRLVGNFVRVKEPIENQATTMAKRQHDISGWCGSGGLEFVIKDANVNRHALCLEEIRALTAAAARASKIRRSLRTSCGLWHDHVAACSRECVGSVSDCINEELA